VPNFPRFVGTIQGLRTVWLGFFFCISAKLPIGKLRVVLIMADIIVFRSMETPKLNYPEIRILFSELGTGQGLRVFERVLFEVSDKLCQLELAVHEKDWQTARRTANSLKLLSPQVGLDSLAAVAGYLTDALAHSDFDIVPAICHRIVCLGEASLFQLAELPRIFMDQ
jgi:hypothetical protein